MTTSDVSSARYNCLNVNGRSNIVVPSDDDDDGICTSLTNKKQCLSLKTENEDTGEIEPSCSWNKQDATTPCNVFIKADCTSLSTSKQTCRTEKWQCMWDKTTKSCVDLIKVNCPTLYTTQKDCKKDKGWQCRWNKKKNKCVNKKQ